MTRTLLAAMTLLLAGCARAPRFAAPIPGVEGRAAQLFSLDFIDVKVGAGAPLAAGRCVYAHYTGWTTDGKKFDSSRDTTNAGRARDPISFPQGFRRVIAGWDLGFQGMHVGGLRRLIIPWQLAYGEKGRAPVLPEKATLIVGETGALVGWRGNAHGEGAAVAESCAVHVDFSIVQFDESAHEGEPDAEPASCAAAGGVDLREHAEDAVVVVCGESNAAVAHADFHDAIVFARVQVDVATRLGVLRGVA